MSYGTVQAEKMTTESGYSLGAGNASSFKNRIINGGMVFDQRNAGATVTPTGGAYTLDRWQFQMSAASKFSVQRSTNAPAGFSNSLLVTSLGAYSVVSTDFFTAQYNIEGFDFADFLWGTANAKSVTLSFWVQSSLTGTFTGAFRNSAGNRAYPYAYTINAANTWQFISITVPGDTTGTWVGATNGTGVQIFFDFGSGSTNQGTPGVWASTGFNAATGQTNLLGTNGATFAITGVQLEAGTVATSFDQRSYTNELALCQRYYCKTYQIGIAPGGGSGVGYEGCIRNTAIATTSYMGFGNWSFPSSMRATPTVTAYDPLSGATNSFVGDGVTYSGVLVNNPGNRGVQFSVSNRAVGTDVFIYVAGTASAEL